MSQLWSLVLLLSVFFLGAQGASQLPGCEGGRGASQLWSWVVVSSSVFVLGGRGAS